METEKPDGNGGQPDAEQHDSCLLAAPTLSAPVLWLVKSAELLSYQTLVQLSPLSFCETDSSAANQGLEFFQLNFEQDAHFLFL